MAQPLQTGDPLKEGAVLEDWPTVVTAERQARYHAAAQVSEGLFADRVDISILANDTILATSYLKTEDVDGLHAGQRMLQREPLRFDDPLTLKGRVGSIRPTSRGTFVTFAFDYVRADGSVPLYGELISFRVDPEAMRSEQGTPPANVDLAGHEKVAHKTMTPERTGGYSFEFPGYLVHFDPEVARSVGLRAPVAQGLMSLTWMTEAIARGGVQRELDLTAAFRHPIFWDDEIDVWQRDETGFMIVGADGRLRSTGRIDQLRR